MGRAGRTQPLGHPAGGSVCVASLYIRIYITSIQLVPATSLKQLKDFAGQSASDRLLYSSWFYVTDTNHSIFLFFFLMPDRSILKLLTAIR